MLLSLIMLTILTPLILTVQLTLTTFTNVITLSTHTHTHTHTHTQKQASLTSGGGKKTVDAPLTPTSPVT